MALQAESPADFAGRISAIDSIGRLPGRPARPARRSTRPTSRSASATATSRPLRSSASGSRPRPSSSAPATSPRRRARPSARVDALVAQADARARRSPRPRSPRSSPTSARSRRPRPRSRSDLAAASQGSRSAVRPAAVAGRRSARPGRQGRASTRSTATAPATPASTSGRAYGSTISRRARWHGHRRVLQHGLRQRHAHRPRRRALDVLRPPVGAAWSAVGAHVKQGPGDRARRCHRIRHRSPPALRGAHQRRAVRPDGLVRRRQEAGRLLIPAPRLTAARAGSGGQHRITPWREVRRLPGCLRPRSRLRPGFTARRALGYVVVAGLAFGAGAARAPSRRRPPTTGVLDEAAARIAGTPREPVDSGDAAEGRGRGHARRPR